MRQQQPLFEPDNLDDDDLPESLYGPDQEPPVEHLLRLLRERGLIVVSKDWLTEDLSMTDAEVIHALTGGR